MSYVQIHRNEFEDWLDGFKSYGQWYLDPRYRGVYIIPLSPHVGISIRSTVGMTDKAKGRGRASGAMRLVSLNHGHTLNRKAMGQKYFARTKNWRDNWAKGVARLRKAYEGSPSFYDAFAQIEDRDNYRKEMLDKITSIDGWQNNDFLQSLHSRVSGGGILTLKQKAALERVVDRRNTPSQTPSQAPQDDQTQKQLSYLRRLWKAAQMAGDDWTMDFVQSIAQQVKAGRTLSPKQRDLVRKKIRRYRVT